jgi:GNAT superfamily N-acetyltransferase
MFRVEKMGVDDFSFAVQLANTMDWNMALEDFEFMAKLEPRGCFVLFHGSERLGIATSVSFGEVGWFGNLVVKEDFRNKGAGALLVKHAIEYLRGTGVETIGLYAYPHLIKFYQSLGFKCDVDFLVFQGKAATSATKRTLRLRATKKTDVPALMDFDCQCFGADRKKLLKPIILDTDNLCYFSTGDDGAIVGYVVAKVYEEMAEVGPLMCRKNRVDVAVSLLKTILVKLRNLNVFICLQAKETTLLETMQKAKLQEKFRVSRMFLGSSVAKNCTYIAESLERG